MGARRKLNRKERGSAGYYERSENNLSGSVAELSSWLNALLMQVTPVRRKSLLQKLSMQLRTRMQQRISRQENPDGSAFEKRKRGRKKMFTKLRKKMQVLVTADEAIIGFQSGFPSFLVGVHQFGDTVPVNEHGAMYKFPVRQLLGLTDDDKEFIKNMVLEMLT